MTTERWKIKMENIAQRKTHLPELWPEVFDTHSPGKQLTETADKATLQFKSQQLEK